MVDTHAVMPYASVVNAETHAVMPYASVVNAETVCSAMQYIT